MRLRVRVMTGSLLEAILPDRFCGVFEYAGCTVLEYEGCTLLGAGMRPVLELFVWNECCESSVEALEPYADSTLPWSPNIVSN